MRIKEMHRGLIISWTSSQCALAPIRAKGGGEGGEGEEGHEEEGVEQEKDNTKCFMRGRMQRAAPRHVRT